MMHVVTEGVRAQGRRLLDLIRPRTIRLLCGNARLTRTQSSSSVLHFFTVSCEENALHHETMINHHVWKN